MEIFVEVAVEVADDVATVLLVGIAIYVSDGGRRAMRNPTTSPITKSKTGISFFMSGFNYVRLLLYQLIYKTMKKVSFMLTLGMFMLFAGVQQVGAVAVPPPLPTEEEQCKNAGWEAYEMFKNQGDCVSFLATDGKNGPDGEII
jgi:hypothetical protein